MAYLVQLPIAALAPKYLGQVAVIAGSYARIAWQNLVNFGIVPLEFVDFEDYNRIEQGDIVSLDNFIEDVKNGSPITVNVRNASGEKLKFDTKHSLSDRQMDILLKGGIINEFKSRIS